MNKKVNMLILVIICIIIFLIQITYKFLKTGNNVIIKSNKDLIGYILNISSYEAKAEITINSNKTTNKYLVEQYYLKPEYSKQIVKEPTSIENLEIKYIDKRLEIKNTNLGLSKIYENYKYINSNILWLSYFIECCNNKYEMEEDNEEIILKTNIQNYKGKMHINKKTGKPTKIRIIDNNNNDKIYIEYKEIKLNNIHENNIFAFTTKDIKKEM